jgi:hypothetical protein
MNVRRLKPPATVLVGVLCLMIGLEAPAMAHQVNVVAHQISGSSIKKHSIAGNRLKPNTLTGAQIKESTLGVVPQAAVAGTAKALPPLVWHQITDFVGTWTDGSKAPSGVGPTVAYAIDAQGIVHLRGHLTGGVADTVAFVLPAAARPKPGDVLYFPLQAAGGDTGKLQVETAGVIPGTSLDGADATDVSNFSALDGVTFAAGS